jgi:hypothetical protein
VSATGVTAFQLPYSAQLIEWELWVHSAVPATWTRRYGVLTQLPGGRLLDAESELRFSVMESYYADERSAAFAPGVAAADRKRSGFELNFLSLSSVRPQLADSFSSRSTVAVAFALQKSDVVLRTQLSDRQSILQLLAVIASTTVSLFSIFAIGFRLTEHHLLGRLGWSSGPVAPAVVPFGGKQLQQVKPADSDESQQPPTPRLAFAKSTHGDAHDEGLPLSVVTSPSGSVAEAAAAPAAESGLAVAPLAACASVELASPSAAGTNDAVHLRVSADLAGAADGSALSPSRHKYAVATPSASSPTVMSREVRLHALPPLQARVGSSAVSASAGLTSVDRPVA